jgi:hypothetical protein
MEVCKESEGEDPRFLNLGRFAAGERGFDTH